MIKYFLCVLIGAVGITYAMEKRVTPTLEKGDSEQELLVSLKTSVDEYVYLGDVYDAGQLRRVKDSIHGAVRKLFMDDSLNGQIDRWINTLENLLRERREGEKSVLIPALVVKGHTLFAESTLPAKDEIGDYVSPSSLPFCETIFDGFEDDESVSPKLSDS